MYLPNTRLTKKVFLLDYAQCSKNWSKDMKSLFASVNFQDNFTLLLPINLKVLKEKLMSFEYENWSNDIRNVSKLSTYCLFKNVYQTESYVKIVTNRQHRSAITQLRCGVLPLKVETGRYQTIPHELRLCTFCSQNSIENEIHFLFYCSKYYLLELICRLNYNRLNQGFCHRLFHR